MKNVRDLGRKGKLQERESQIRGVESSSGWGGTVETPLPQQALGGNSNQRTLGVDIDTVCCRSLSKSKKFPSPPRSGELDSSFFSIAALAWWKG